MEIMEKAYAKINIGLHVVKKTKNNYHKLDMIMTPVSLYDEIYFSDSDEISVLMDNTICDMEHNLCFKIAKYLKDTYNIEKGINIRIIKNIPSGAGMGGGSSDGACVLKYLNNYWNLNLNKKELINIGMKFGCDIPFFIENKISRVKGFGEIVKPLKIDYFEKPILLIVPNFQMETKNVFKNFVEYNKNKIPNTIKGLKAQRIIPCNDLEVTVDKLTSNKISKIKCALNKKNINNVMMTGSGSVIVCYLENVLSEKELNDIRKDLKDCNVSLSNLKMYTY